ncbi:hypothetical protein CPCC7001_113 [Cyanobium sp. PCC 7001]|uniref:hypothetical protein n=1 Tax=Cyanobium sp. PCC 7001 TaxID=180281 RepID=UPI00018049A1|nr:hypothetical protein [Cyanobium sp. PCC 7001]EDY37235.1 hypothetical protein CPCC7001_113 [Cyanobium sp. PCC 7001]
MNRRLQALLAERGFRIDALQPLPVLGRADDPWARGLACGSPEWVARRLTLALLRGDRQQALPLLLPGADPAMVFVGAAGQPEPSGHLLALALEMPLVRLAQREAAALPDGQVAWASTDPDHLLLLR